MSVVIIAGIQDVTQLEQQDLTTVDNVRAMLQARGGDTDQDQVIAKWITTASRAIENWAGREFAPRPEPEARTFTYNGDNVLSVAPYDLRAVLSIVDYADLPADQQITLTSSDYSLQPTYSPNGVYTGLAVPMAGTAARWMTITGYWGMPSVPEDVEMACLITVREWLRPVSAFNHPFTSDTPPERPVSIPYAAQDLLSPYRVPVIA